MVYSQNNSHRDNDRIRYELKERIGVLGIKDNGWTKEVNLVSWNGAVPKVDIRDWDPAHERMAKGITMLEEEAEKLAKALAKRYGIGQPNNSSRHDSSFAGEPDVTPFEEADAATYDAGTAEGSAAADEGNPEEGSTDNSALA